MPPKTVKKHVKKKVIKKKIIPKTKKSNQSHTNHESQSINSNSLRSQLLANPFGYHSQQYGNFNADQKIKDLTNNNQQMVQQLNNQRILYDATKKEGDELKKETKELKKQIKNMMKERDKEKNKLEMTKDEVSDAHRIENETNRLKQQTRQKEQELSEINVKNDIINKKMEVDSLDSQVHAKKLENQRLQNNYESNHAFQQLLNLRSEMKNEINKNQGLIEAMKDNAFTNPNEEMEKTYKNLEIARQQNNIAEEQKKMQNEIISLKLEQSKVLSPEDEEAITNQYAKDFQTKHTNIVKLKNDVYKARQKQNEFDYKTNKLNELDNTILNLTYEKEMYDNQAEALEKSITEQLDPEIAKKIQKQAELSTGIDKAKKRIQRANEQQKLIEEKAKTDAICKELSKKLSNEEEEEIKELANMNAEIENEREHIQSLKERRKANFELSKERARKALLENEDFNKLSEERMNIEMQTLKTQREARQTELLNKSIEKSQEAQFAKQVQDKCVNDDFSATQQASYLLNEGTNKMNEMLEKDKIIEELNSYRRTQIKAWEAFVSINSNTDISTTKTFQDMPIEELRAIKSAFIKFLSQNSQEIEQEQNLTQIQPSLAQPVDLDSIIPINKENNDNSD